MKAILIIPAGGQEGNLIWMPPYIYANELMDGALQELADKGYLIEKLEEESGLKFASGYTGQEMLIDFENAFRWMDITFYEKEEDIDFKKDIFNYATVILPVARLEIEAPIVTRYLCLFPPGWIFAPSISMINGEPFEKAIPQHLRDLITQTTDITTTVFTNMPVIVFDQKIWIEDYLNMSQIDDIALIKTCSRVAEPMLDLLRYYRSDFMSQEFLPAKAGIWNDRYSAMLVYFPVNGKSYIQSREVEIKTFIKGIGMDVSYNDSINISLHPLMYPNTNELQNITKHALRMYSGIAELDDDTMRFTQIMTLFDYLGDPYRFGKFKEMKKKFLACIVTDQRSYNALAKRFLELTHGIEDENGAFQTGMRTAIVHMGSNLEEMIPSDSIRKALFKELHGYVYALIRHMMFSPSETWAQYDQERIALKSSKGIK